MSVKQLKRSEPVYKQIAAHFQDRIARGELQPGEMIPTTFELAREFEVANQTAQNALQELSRRGMVTRIPRTGTFVSQNVKAATMAIVCGRSLLSEPDTRVYGQIAWNIAEFVAEQGYDSKLYTPAQPEKERSMIMDLERDIRNGLIRAVVVVNKSTQLGPWLENDCTVPHCIANGFDGKLTYISRAIALGMGYLRDRGYRRVGVMVSRFVASRPALMEKEISALRDVDPTLPEFEMLVPAANFPSSGMKLVQSMDLAAARLDALFVTDDNLCGGVIVGMLAQGLRIPQDIGLLTLANKDLEILSPFPLTRIECDPVFAARDQVQCLLHLLKGHDSKPTSPLRDPKLVRGQSCGE